MTANDCLFEQAAYYGMGISLFFISVGLSIIGVTLMPLLGLFTGVPVFLIAAYFFIAPRSKECRIG